MTDPATFAAIAAMAVVRQAQTWERVLSQDPDNHDEMEAADRGLVKAVQRLNEILATPAPEPQHPPAEESVPWREVVKGDQARGKDGNFYDVGEVTLLDVIGSLPVRVRASIRLGGEFKEKIMPAGLLVTVRRGEAGRILTVLRGAFPNAEVL